MEKTFSYFNNADAPIQTLNAIFGIDDAIIIIIILIIALALSLALAPKPPRPPDAEFQKQQAPTNDPSKYVGVIFGRARIKDPTIAWFGNTSAEPIMSDNAGKKG